MPIHSEVESGYHRDRALGRVQQLMQRAGAQKHAHLHVKDATVVAHHLLMHFLRLLGGVFGTAGSAVLRQEMVSMTRQP